MSVDWQRIAADVRIARRWLERGDVPAVAPDALCRHCEQLLAETARLHDGIRTLLLGSLLEVRRAAFSQEIGSRMNEAFRAEIANACARLEDHARRLIDPSNQTEPGGSTLDETSATRLRGGKSSA